MKHITLVVKDYDEAIEFYVKKLDFEIIKDTQKTKSTRCVVIKPRGQSDFSLQLEKAKNKIQEASIGNQSKGSMFLFLHTSDLDSYYQRLLQHNVKIINEPSNQQLGKVAKFSDLYGNLWDLIEPQSPKSNYFYSTAILKTQVRGNHAYTEQALRELRSKTILEPGCISFEIQKSQNMIGTYIIWECFKDYRAFQYHLETNHLHEFLRLNLAILEHGMVGKRMEYYD